MVNDATLLAAAYRNMPDACLLVAYCCEDDEYRYTVHSVNPAFCQLAGVPEHELVGQQVHKLLGVRLYQKLAQQGIEVVQTGETASGEYRITMPSGKRTLAVLMVPCAQQGKLHPYILVIVRDATQERLKIAHLHAALHKSKQIMSSMEKRHASLLQSIMEVQEKEHQRIAFALHEEFAQVISAALMSFSSLDVVVGKSVREQEQQVEYAMEVMNSLLHDVKALAYDLMPTALHTFGLVAALEDLFLNMGEVVSATFALHTYGYRRLAWVVEVTLYRIIREIISTMYTCYDGADISVQLVMHQHMLSIVIDDNGQCTLAQKMREANSKNPEHMMRGVVARVQLLNGSLNIDSHEQSGTVIAIDIPLHESFFMDELNTGEVREP